MDVLFFLMLIVFLFKDSSFFGLKISDKIFLVIVILKMLYDNFITKQL